MQNQTLFFPGFHPQTLRRKPRSAQQVLADNLKRLKQKSFSQLSEYLGALIPHRYLQPTSSGANSRQRMYSKHNTFWAFFSQILDLVAFAETKEGRCRPMPAVLRCAAARRTCFDFNYWILWRGFY